MNSPRMDHSISINMLKENKLASSNVQVVMCSNEEELRNCDIKKSVDPQYRCNICSKRYTSLSVLKTHKIRHEAKQDQPFYCMFCSFRAAAKRDLQRHHDQHVGLARQIFKCSHCSKSFKNSTGLSEHVKSVHIRNILYKCGLCSFTCWRRSSFRLHLKVHDSKVQIICPICDAPFQTKSNLQTHLMTHAGAKPFECDQCNKSFKVKNHLVSHQRRVHSPRTFDCELCQKRFSTTHHLKRHTLIHTGERPFKCCFCSFDSNTQGNLVKHVRGIHHALHFTYKDILMKSGLIEDPKKSLTPEDIERMTERGRETSESYMKVLREKGLTIASLEQLQQKERSLKEKAKASVLQTRDVKKQKAKKGKKNSNSRKDVRENVEKAKANKNGKENNKTGFSFPNGHEFMLPRIEDVIPPMDNSDGLSNTPTIQVIWNVNYSPNIQKATLPLNKKTKSKSPTKPRTKDKTCKSVKKKIIRESSSSNVRLTLESEPPTDSDHPPSNILEDNDLAFEDKPLLHHLQASNGLHSCSGSVLVTPLNNLHPDLVGFEEIGGPNTVVVTSEGISYIDKVYKNMDLCNQFLHINDDETHFIHAFESSSLQRESKFIKPETQTCSNESVYKNQFKERFNSLKVLTTSSNQVCDNFRNTNTKEDLNLFTTEQLTTNYTHILENKSKEDIRDAGTEDSNLIIDIKPLERTISEDSLSICRTDPEEVLLFDESSGAGGMISSFLFIPEEDTSSQPQKEITITDTVWNKMLNNDEMEVTSIAEIEENEGDVVLVIDALS